MHLLFPLTQFSCEPMSYCIAQQLCTSEFTKNGLKLTFTGKNIYQTSFLLSTNLSKINSENFNKLKVIKKRSKSAI